MAPASAITAPSRRHPTVAAILKTWRALTGGKQVRDADRRTLIACSGGADSAALALALSSLPVKVVIAHIVHDMRDPESAHADRDFVRLLARSLGLDFVERQVHVHVRKTSDARTSSVEARARRERYAALAALALQSQCRYVATAHHADDQVETVLMRLLRGSGPAGLAGIAPLRPLAPGIDLIRPMLALTRAQGRELCQGSNLTWREDTTNLDTRYLRAALRHQIMPTLTTLAPRLAQSVANSAELMRGAAILIAERAAHVSRQASTNGPIEPPSPERTISWSRAELRPCSAVVVGEVLRNAVRELTNGRGLDALSLRSVLAVVRSVHARSTDPKRCRLGPASVEITAHTVRISLAKNAPADRTGNRHASQHD